MILTYRQVIALKSFQEIVKGNIQFVSTSNTASVSALRVKMLLKWK